MLSTVTQHPAGISYVCLPEAIHPCHTVQYEAMSIFYMYILCVRGVKVARCIRMYSNRNFLGDWIFCALSLLLYSLLHTFCNECVRFKNNLNFIYVKLVHSDPVNILL